MWKYLLEKEFKQFFRDPGLPRMALAFPVLMMLVFPFAVSMDIRNIDLAVVDNCTSRESVLLVEKCISSGYFRLVDVCHDGASAQKLMDDGKADAVLTIMPDFDRELVLGTGLPLGIKVNAVNGSKGSIGSQYLLGCVRDYLAGRQAPGGTIAAAPSVVVTEQYCFNPYMDYKLFMVPALIVIAITMITAFLPALNIVAEKEAGTIEQMNVTPVSKTAFIVCKMIPYWAIAFFILSACLLIAWLVFGYVCKGSLWAVFLFTVMHIMVTAGLGLLISNYSDNAQQAMFIMMFFVLIFMLMSGVFTPVSSMPGWARAITYANPLRYYADAMRSVFLKGSSIADVWYDAAGLLAIGSLALTWAIISYRKTS